MQINPIFVVALLLLLALVVGRLAKLLRLPEVIGYLAVGVMVGPSALNMISEETLTALNFLSEIAIGLILFSIGAVFEFSQLRRVGSRLLYLVSFESFGAGILVAVGMLLLGTQPSAALLLGATAMATAPASTLLVLREYRAAGPLTETLLGVIAVNNVFALFVYGLLTAGLQLTRHTVEVSWLSLVGTELFNLLWLLVGAVAVGFLAGLLLTVVNNYLREHGERLTLLIGAILLVLGAAKFLGVSALVAALALGATVTNLVGGNHNIFSALEQTDPPIYAVFFVIVGADLSLDNLSALGLVGLAYILLRLVGKVGGAYWGSHLLRMPPSVNRYLGLALIAQAGLAIGLVLDIRLRYPDLAPFISTVVLASIFIYEFIGPVAARYAVILAGEQNQVVPVPR